MKLSREQSLLFWRLWSGACRRNGWTIERGVSREEIEAKRHAFLGSLGFSSLRQVGQTGDFDAVKAALLALQDDVAWAVETDHPEMGLARRMRWKISHDLMPKLEASGVNAGAYVAAIVRDKFGMGAVDLDRLKVRQLRELLVTLTQRLAIHRDRRTTSPAG